MALCTCGQNHPCTTYHPSDNEPPCPPPSSSNNHREASPSPHVASGPTPVCPLISNHRTNRLEEPPYPSLPPPSHELDDCIGTFIYITRFLLHLTQRHTRNGAVCPWCDQELPYPPTPNPNDHSEQPPTASPCMTENHRLQPQQPICNANKPTFRVYTKAKPDFSLTIRNGKVILAPSKPSDPRQQWFKEEKFGKNLKDEEGFTSFALVNKATGQAMKYPIGVTYTCNGVG
ncbi:hypothetical protein L2E82_34581 [Cichorium intybus]|uniref:Uncharacterized protein n=1 Tax=Cichorium intybus TaxID=13427 RepID=A0ACB9BMH2_CICIN|nr:hypothetical protein L2E82_34581 [Cichorium intybus]